MLRWNSCFLYGLASLVLCFFPGCGPASLTDSQKAEILSDAEERIEEMTDRPKMSEMQKEAIASRVRRSARQLAGENPSDPPDDE